MSEPLRLIWDALEAHDCRPRGKPYDFRARCPGHNGQNRDSLHVGVGADARAVLWCHAHQCDVETITAALGLSVQDLFLPGHHLGRRFASRPLRRPDFSGPAHTAANVLYAFELLEKPWRLMLASDCPYCGSRSAWLYVTRRQTLANGLLDVDGVEVDCPGGCGSREYTQALLARLARKDENNA